MENGQVEINKDFVVLLIPKDFPTDTDDLTDEFEAHLHGYLVFDPPPVETEDEKIETTPKKKTRKLIRPVVRNQIKKVTPSGNNLRRLNKTKVDNDTPSTETTETASSSPTVSEDHRKTRRKQILVTHRDYIEEHSYYMR